MYFSISFFSFFLKKQVEKERVIRVEHGKRALISQAIGKKKKKKLEVKKGAVCLPVDGGPFSLLHPDFCYIYIYSILYIIHVHPGPGQALTLLLLVFLSFFLASLLFFKW